MTSKKWLTIKPTKVLVRDLLPGQDGVTFDGLRTALAGEQSWCGDPIIHVVVWAGRLWVEDGHHRYTIALCRGDEWITARVFTHA